MGWIKVSDDFYDNDKMFAAGSIGRDLYWHGMAFCNRNLTDGLIPKGRALTLVDFTDAAVMIGMGGVDGQDCAPIAVERCLDAGLWHEQGHDCPSCIQPGPRHYIVHDYLKYQPSKAEVQAKAEATRKRVDAWRQSQKSSNSVGNSVTNGVHTQAVTPDVHHTPTPTPTPSSSCRDLGGEVALSNARESEPPSKCSKHLNHPDPPNCVPCKNARLANEAWHAAQVDDELAQRRQRKERSDNCPVCHGTNWIPDTDPAVKCDHQATAHA
jgi:hypothetical protein